MNVSTLFCVHRSIPVLDNSCNNVHYRLFFVFVFVDGPSESPTGVSAPSNVFFNAKLTQHVTLDALHIVVFDQVNLM